MGKKCKKQECPAGEKWAVPYADFLSLLLALFIALYAISAANTEKVKALKTEFIKIFDYPASKTTDNIVSQGNKESNAKNDAKSQLEQLKATNAEQEQTIKELKAMLDQSEGQISLDMPDGVTFKAGETQVTDQNSIEFIKTTAKIANKLPQNISVEIRGYAGGSANGLESFELGYKRAMSVAQILADDGLDASRMRIVSYGNEPAPKSVSGSDSNRVQIFFRVDKNDTKTQKSVLDALKGLQ